MKTIPILLLTFLLIFISYSYSQEIVQKEYCMSSIGYQGTSDELRAELLMEAKRLAVGEFFGEFISSYTEVEMFTLTEDRIVASSAGLVRIKGSPVFESGDSFGEVCVSIDAYVTKEDLDKFKPISITKKNCVSDQNLTASQIKKHAKEQAIITALVDYDRKLESRNKEDLLPLIHNIEYLESGFIPGTESYCVTFEGVIYPIEIFALGAKITGKVDEPTKEKITAELVKKPVVEKVRGAGTLFFEEDFSGVIEGGIPDGWTGGDNMVVGQVGRSKSLYLSPSGKSSDVVITQPISFPENYRLEIVVSIPNSCWGSFRIYVGSVFLGNSCCTILFNEDSKHDCKIGKSAIFVLEKNGKIFTVSLNEKKYHISRISQYDRPKNIRIKLAGDHRKAVALHKIIGTEL